MVQVALAWSNSFASVQEQLTPEIMQSIALGEPCAQEPICTESAAGLDTSRAPQTMATQWPASCSDDTKLHSILPHHHHHHYHHHHPSTAGEQQPSHGHIYVHGQGDVRADNKSQGLFSDSRHAPYHRRNSQLGHAAAERSLGALQQRRSLDGSSGYMPPRRQSLQERSLRTQDRDSRSSTWHARRGSLQERIPRRHLSMAEE
jgi:hypothetical protein